MITDAVYTDDLAFFINTLAQAKYLQNSIGL